MDKLEASEKNYFAQAEQREFSRLAKVQGIHAPLRLVVERKVVSRGGHLPFLPRSNASLDVLTGRDEMIGFDDFLGHPHEQEALRQPHATMDKKFVV